MKLFAALKFSNNGQRIDTKKFIKIINMHRKKIMEKNQNQKIQTEKIPRLSNPL
ncbi:hypothetical protein C2G38_2053243 [Gigaspora rosea]|uniref:Uncharacterized protein n=1 Tax=Gigaspora rosea TaxID=44941 RepID=A0A397W7H6_9GLOM|nr:hypothetical protein C2G38_2053243 [Gigaspora rosea]